MGVYDPPEVLFTMALGLGEGWSVKSCSFEGPPEATDEIGLQGRAPICVSGVRDLRTCS